MKIWSEYNFDIILAEEKARSTALDYPVSLGGNKEYYQSMQSLVHYNYGQLKEIFDIGLHTYGLYPESELDYYYHHSLDYYKQKRGKVKKNELNDTNTKKRIIAVHQKLQEIYELLQFADPIASQHELVEKQLRQTQKQKGNTMTDNKSQDFEQMKNDECSYSNNSNHSIVEILETGFAKEITFLYYLNLNNNIYIPILFPISNFQSFQTLILESTLAYVRKETSQNDEKVDFLSNRPPSSILPLSPKEKLSKILRQDQDIGNWFCLCMSDIIAYQNQTAEIMSQSYNQIKK